MKENKSVFKTLRLALSTLFANKAILFPYAIIIFIQLLILEIFFFAPRYPLNVFFGPIIRKLWTDSYLHYPLNFALLPSLFQNLQMPLFILVNSYLIAVSINTLVAVNNGSKIKMGEMFKKSLSSYVHVVIAAILSVIVTVLFIKGYGMIFKRALMIRSETGLYGNIKKIVVYGAPYFNLLLNILGSCLFIYVIPIIVIEKKNVFKAIFLNFKVLFRSFFFTLFVIFVPSALYVIILLLKDNVGINTPFPELSVVVMALGIFLVTIIDAIVYTSVSTYYLLRKESM